MSVLLLPSPILTFPSASPLSSPSPHGQSFPFHASCIFSPLLSMPNVVFIFIFSGFLAHSQGSCSFKFQFFSFLLFCNIFSGIFIFQSFPHGNISLTKKAQSTHVLYMLTSQEGTLPSDPAF